MWSRASSETARAAGGRCPDPSGSDGALIRAAARPRFAVMLCALTLAALSACSSTPPRAKGPPATSASAPAASAHPAPGTAVAPGAAPAGGAAAAGAASKAAGGDAAASTATGAAHPEAPPAARTDFDRAVQFMRSGNAIEAELGFKQVALQYPQFSAPLVNLAILQRKEGHLDQAETTLKDAVAAREWQRGRLDRARRDAAHARGVPRRRFFLRAGDCRRSALCTGLAEPWRGVRPLSGGS